MPTRGTILGLDLAATTGFAMLSMDGSYREGGSWPLGGGGEDHDCERLATLAGYLEFHLTSTIVAIETPFVHPKNLKTGLTLAEYAGVVKSWCHLRGVRLVRYAPASIKKFATGSGKADKDAMEKFAENEWPGVKWSDDNHVDAAWVAAYAASQERADA